ncbi:HlyD family secretion protein [Actinoplanes campanulatus]|uniref:HlyD family secretion protein n=1 Tax=Actinoplanes campanulatus TaxID=113559 RepID=A0A7W5FEA9_9ACTN|nr:efflux RND transporter periplasmic adaptor subunit [Actinoplanes campanulatus]MBB3095318.1 HlyD family secretion protein [Actinoplanes campanulatus]
MSRKTGRNGRRIGALLVVAGAVAAGIILAVQRNETATPPPTVVADRGEVTRVVATTGTVEPAATLGLAFGVNGTVASVSVRPGNRVTKGQALAALDGTGAADDVTDAEAALSEAQSRLSEARTVSVSTTASATACARPKAAAAGPCATRGYPDTGGDPVLTAEQQVYQAAHRVEEAEEAFKGTTLKAPIAGTVLAVEGSVGDHAQRGSTFVSLADTYAMRVRAAFPEADATALETGQSATITPAGSDGTYAGEVVQVDPVGTRDGTLVRYGVLLSVAHPPSDLLVGQSAQVEVRTGQVDSALRVPSTAVHDVSGDSGTVLVRSGGQSVARTVTLGLQGDEYTEITGGLAEGDQVVRFR